MRKHFVFVLPLFLCLLFGSWVNPTTYPKPTLVTEHGIHNDGTPIGKELNDLVKKNYGGTLYFPAGIYNLTEPIVLPFDYRKNVNLILDHNAVIKSDTHLEALLKIGFIEMEHPDHGLRLFSFVEGGVFNAENADRGIWVNGLKQLVSLRGLSVIKCKGKHIELSATNEFKGGNSDTKFDNITIEGTSSDEDNYGIYIDSRCSDNKISDCFIYGTKCGIYVKSAGVIANNVHILSWIVGKGKRQEHTFAGTVGIQIASSGFNQFNQIYFDTTERDIVINKGCTPELILNHCMTYSYRKDFGKCFIYRDKEDKGPFQAKISNSIFSINKKEVGFRVFDLAPEVIPYDCKGGIAYTDNVFDNEHRLSPFCQSLMMKFKHHQAEAVVDKPKTFNVGEWYALGAVTMSYATNDLTVIFDGNSKYKLSLDFDGKDLHLLQSQAFTRSKRLPAELGYAVKDGLCILFFKPTAEATLFPQVIDNVGNTTFMSTPCKYRNYGPADYQVTTQPTIINFKKIKQHD